MLAQEGAKVTSIDTRVIGRVGDVLTVLCKDLRQVLALENIVPLLLRFFEGHGDESLTDAFDKLLRTLRIAGDELKIHQASYEEVKNE